ncbi:outer membrane beta-barrel protein [Ferruginibacter sp. SUN106]|uniref:outer membrane beta-barrel protein n=1 Tax=Ferruginibacter sp. SUN106 TaxID=2978348 RepID=UPI003D363509
MKQKLLLIAAVILFSAFQLKAQNSSTITGQVKDATGNGVAAATVTLHNAKDSSLAKTAVTNNSGTYEMPSIKAGKYFIRVTATGMQKAGTPAFDVADGEKATAPSIALKPAEKSLQAVTVTSQKPMVEVRADKMIVNVEGTINAVGNDALELLRKSPGVIVDKDDNVTLSGKNGVQIYIDGKPSPLSGADLAAYLKSLQSSQIESIELITNPSAKYEAAGNAGIINIKLKKDKTIGTNGSVNAGYNIGTYAKYNGGIALNHRNKKMNLFGNYNYNQGLNESNFSIYRIQKDTIFDQKSRITQNNKYGHNFKTGVDFFINKKSTFGVVVNGNVSASDIVTEGPMKIIYKPTNTLSRLLLANGDNATTRSNVNFNLNYRYAVTGGSELNLDADYGFFNLRTHQYQPNDYYDGSTNVKLNSNIYRTVSPTDIGIFALKGDYEQNFKKGRLGYGGKIGVVNTDNDFARWNIYNNNAEVYDTASSNRFRYNENINAAYVNFNKAYKGFFIQVGLRAENTTSEGRTTGFKNVAPQFTTPVYVPLDTTVKRNYLDFFPSGAITFNKNPMKQFGFTFSRRIDRPVYQDLNPFEFKINDYTYMKGNTQLRPQYTNSVGFTYTYKYRLNTGLNYSHVKDIFAQIPDTLGSKSFITKKNLATQDIVSLNVSYPFQKKWYSFFANLNSFYSKYKADYDGGDRKINLDVVAVSFFMQNSFNLGKGYKAELSGFYNSPSVYQGTIKARGLYSIDGGIQKTIFKGMGNLKASVSDMFKLLRFKGSLDYTGQHSDVLAHWESRQFKLNFSYRFGNSQVKAARQRKEAIEEENKRSQQSSGGMGVGGN